MSLGSFSVRHGVLLNIFVILVCVWGVMSFLNMPRDLFPDVTTESIMVTTIMPGASPKEIEELITIPIEEELIKVDQVDELISSSGEGASTIFMTFETGVDNFFEKVTDVQNNVNRVRDLPEDAEKPVVQEIKVAFDIITVSLVGDAPELDMREFAERLDDEIKLIDGVQEIDITGLREREVWIEVDPSRLNAYGLSLSQVAAAVRARNLNLPGGMIRMGRGEFSVRTEAEYKNLDQILETVVKQDGEEGYVYLRDIATVKNTFEERKSLSRLDGRPAITLMVKKDKKSNAITLVEKVRAKVDEMRPQAPPGTDVTVIDDRSLEIKNQLDSLGSNLMTGLILVVIIITISIGWRASLLVGSGMLMAFLATFVFMDLFGYTINMLTLFGLIMVLGMLCDDAIVVCENVYRYYEAGMPLKEAAIRGVDEIAWPVIASVSTTVAAFLPLGMMTGVLGQFMGVIPVVVALALVASLFEALLILPAHIYEIGSPKKSASSNKKAGPPRWMIALNSMYEGFIGFCLRIRYLVLPIAGAVAVFAVYVATNHMDFILFGGRDLQAFSLAIETPSGSSLRETTRVLQEVEEKALELQKTTPEMEYVRMRVGSLQTAPGMMGQASSNVGEVQVKLVPLYERTRLGQDIREEYRAMVTDATGYRTMNFEDRSNGPPVGKAVQVRVRGENFDTLREIAEIVKAELRQIEGVTDIMDNFPPGKEELRPKLDMEKVSALGLDVRQVATEVRGAFDGLMATTIHDGKDELDVMVKFKEDSRNSSSNLKDILFSTPSGLIPLSSIGEMERAPGVAQISHFNARRTINVLADVSEEMTSYGKKMTSKLANEMLAERLKGLEDKYPGYTLSFGGEFEDISESLDSLMRAMLIAVILIFMILGGIFDSFVQPFIVMFTVPLGFIGVVFGFWIMNEPLGMFAIIGIIGLAGIVVNNAIILIDFINERRRAGADRRQSIIEAGSVRLRPILLTSITTVLGLMPMTINLFGVDPLMKPMALAVSWGLIFATALTLVVIPCLYSIFDDFYWLILRRPLGISGDQWAELKEQGLIQENGLPASGASEAKA